ncbi:MAG TPA: hypothetical protein VF085_02195, partial [Solirubrobacterales bacterium]
SLYVYDETDNEVRQFNSACGEKENFLGEKESFANGDATASTGLAASVTCFGEATAKKNADIYLSDAVQDNGKVRAYGPAPDNTALCEKPPFAPVILAQYAVSVGSMEAVFRTRIAPRFYADTTYQLRYATAACIEGGGWNAPCVASKPPTPASLGATAVDFPFTSPIVEIDGLVPATAYRYRFIAQSGGGGPVAGLVQSFTTFPPPTGQASCPNEAFRTGAAALLPDCRAYELVSPLDKEGGQILTLDTGLGRPAALDQSASSGDKLTYSSYTPFAGAQSAPFNSQYIADREAGVGWASEAISPPRGTNFSQSAGGAFFPGGASEYEAFSADLCSGWLLRDATTAPPLAVGADLLSRNYYKRSNCGVKAGSYETLSRVGTESLVRLQGVSVDGSRAIFHTDLHLSQDAANAVGTRLRCQPATFVPVTYQWLREGEPIATATASQYIAGAEDEGKTIQCRLRASGGGGASVSDATPAFVIAPYPASEPPLAPQVIPAPSADAQLEVGGAGGQTLGCDPNAAAWEGSPGFAYQWYRNGVALASATEPLYSVQPADLASAATFQCEVLATNAGGTVVAMSEAVATTPGPGAPVARASMATAEGVVYESDGEGGVSAVCILPSGLQSDGCTAGTRNLGFNSSNSSDSVGGALSTDGSRAFWTTSQLNEGPIYARIDGKETVDVSKAAGVGAARFWLAAADGSRAIVSSAGKLYEVDLSDSKAPVKRTIAEQGFVGVVGASSDASLLYFASTKALAGAAQEGKPNLYLRRRSAGGEALTFVATLAPADVPVGNIGGSGLSPVAVEPYEHGARTSADGTHLAFMSRASLTGYDNADAASEQADAEVFVYDAGTGKLVC